MKALILLSLSIVLMAQSVSIDEQIAQLQSVEPQKRYELMNAIKIRISSMNAAERSAAISKLQKNRNNTQSAHNNQQLHHSANQMQQMNQQNRHQNASGGRGANNQKPHQGNHGNKH